MKKDRNCSAPYPIYPPYTGMINPMMNPGMMSMMPTTMDQSNMVTSNNIDQLNNIEQRINNLENRISNLENKLNTNYNSSNYQML